MLTFMTCTTVFPQTMMRLALHTLSEISFFYRNRGIEVMVHNPCSCLREIKSKLIGT